MGEKSKPVTNGHAEIVTERAIIRLFRIKERFQEPKFLKSEDTGHLYLVWNADGDKALHTNNQINSCLDDRALFVGTLKDIPQKDHAELLLLLCAPKEQTDPIEYLSGLLGRPKIKVERMILVYTPIVHRPSLN